MYVVRLVLAAAALSLATTALAQDQPPKWGASIDVEGKLGTKRNLGEADAFAPLWQDDRNLVFGNARFRMDDDNSKEGNLGLGYRTMLNGGWNLGAYGYVDRRRSETAHMFHQLTFGAEALGRDFDARVNSYWPVGETVKPVDSLNTATLSGTSVIFRGGEERAIGGFDGEVGWRVPVFEYEGPYDFRVYAGGYTFDDEDVPDITGPRLRAELTAYELPYLWAGTRLTLGAEWQTDDVRGSQGFLSARLRIPLQSEAQRNRALTAQERRMTTPVVRDIDIVAQAGQFSAPEVATQTASGQTLTVISSASNTGATLTDELTAAGANSTVILSGTFATTAQSTMQAGQTLMGASPVTVRAPSGRTATFTPPAATINGALPTGIATVELANNATVAGLTMTNTVNGNAYVVTGTSVTGVTLMNNTIAATATAVSSRSVRIFGTSSVVLRGNTITATSPGGLPAIAIELVGGTINATVSGNTLTATGGTNRIMDYQNTTFSADSTGNVRGGGSCGNSGSNTGSVAFTDGTTCN